MTKASKRARKPADGSTAESSPPGTAQLETPEPAATPAAGAGPSIGEAFA